MRFVRSIQHGLKTSARDSDVSRAPHTHAMRYNTIVPDDSDPNVRKEDKGGWRHTPRLHLMLKVELVAQVNKATLQCAANDPKSKLCTNRAVIATKQQVTERRLIKVGIAAARIRPYPLCAVPRLNIHALKSHVNCRACDGNCERWRRDRVWRWCGRWARWRWR